MSDVVNLLIVIALWTAFYKMIVSKRFWLSVLGSALSIFLVVYLSFHLGYKLANSRHSCSPPPIEVYL